MLIGFGALVSASIHGGNFELFELFELYELFESFELLHPSFFPVMEDCRN